MSRARPHAQASYAGLSPAPWINRWSIRRLVIAVFVASLLFWCALAYVVFA